MTDPIPGYRPKINPYLRPSEDGTHFRLVYPDANGSLRNMLLDVEQLARLGMDIDRIRLVRGAHFLAESVGSLGTTA